MIGQEGDVLHRLEDEVERALRESRGVQDLVLSWFGALQELAQPGVEWWDAEQAESRARAGEEGGEGGERGGAGAGCCGMAGFSEALEEAVLERECSGFQVY